MSAPAASPLAQALFAWAFGPRATPIAATSCAVFGAVLVIAEFVHPREGSRLAFEGQPGFYALLGVGAVGAALAVAATLRWALLRDAPYTDEVEARKGRDDGRA